MLSPHCDDAVLSLGGLLAARRGVGRTTVLTLLAGDPAAQGPPGEWDRRSGFTSAAQATRVRRDEDRRACRRLGAVAVHLDGTDEQYADTLSDDEIWELARPAVERADEVLLPGHPLRHPDHRRVAALVLARLEPDRPVRLYLEEPYATWTGMAPPGAGAGGDQALRWTPTSPGVPQLLRGLHATSCYRTQLTPLADYVPRAGRASRLLGTGPTALLVHLGRAALGRGQTVSEPVPASRARGALQLDDGRA